MNADENRSFFNADYAILKLTVITIFTILLIVAIYFFSKDNLLFGLAALCVPIPFLFIYQVFKDQRFSFISALYCNYFGIGLSRYIPAPLGLTVDILLFLTLVSLIFSQFNHKVKWSNAANDYTIWALLWFGMTLMQLFNPEAVSRQAWFYAMRGQAFYIVLAVPLVYLVFNKPKDFETLIKLCAWFTLVAVLKALMQKYIGVDTWEKRWLAVPGNRTTHILFGQLRVFSIYSDAGTFGGSMGYFGVVYIVLAMHEKIKKNKYFYFFVGFMSLYAMLISGTRSAIAVPVTGFVVYTMLTKRVKIMVTVGILLFSVFFILKYTTIGQGNYDIRRMRSAFSEDNASLNVRLENRKLFAAYLKTRPFGGGIGSSGNWGHRFSPNTFLADTATDGWYIQLWAEQGVVGLTFYLMLLMYFLLKSTFLIFFRLKKPENLYKAIAFTAGMVGLMVSSYSASSLGQMPNTVIVFTSITLISLMPKWEKEENEANEAKLNELSKQTLTIE